jgi:hypothetical protein
LFSLFFNDPQPTQNKKTDVIRDVHHSSEWCKKGGGPLAKTTGVGDRKYFYF